jgi:putative nucleotidyltransferase with HDIG domain
MCKSILFVDDEPSIRGIYEMLQPFLGEDYSVSTAPGGQEGLQLLEERPYDVVVSDLTMPHMNGIEFLTEVSQRYPATARIVISGFADEITAAKCLMVGHRYFSKPFSPMVLTEVLVSVCTAQEAAASEKLREFVGKLDGIPTLARTYVELTRLLHSNAFPIGDLSAIIEKDPVLTAKLLQMANSVRFAPTRRISTVFEAVQLIGFDLVRAMVLGVQVFEWCNKIAKTKLFDRVWEHSVQTAVFAKKLAQLEQLDAEKCEEAFLLGLLHDIGKVVLGATCPEYQALWSEYGNDSRKLVARERQVIGATHAGAGAYLLRLWGLPEAVSRDIAAHHNLETIKTTGFTPLLAVHLAQELAANREAPLLDEAAIAQSGLAARMPEWINAIRAEEAKAN